MLELHPLCLIFPRMAGEPFDGLKADIKANGLNNPITLYEGKILDGGNRYRACLELGIEPRTSAFDGINPAAFVLSQNLHRRNMTPGQQATVVALATDWERAHKRGGDRKSDQNTSLYFDSMKVRAATAGVGTVTQAHADVVAKRAPELAAKVVSGEITLPQAHRQVSEKRAPHTTPIHYASEPAQPAAVIDDSETIRLRGHAMACAQSAIAKLREILPSNPARAEALADVRRWIEFNK